jgi:hypothetical protein
MRILLVGVLGVAASASVACGGGNTCEDAIANASKLYGFGGATYASMRAQGIEKCKSEKWPDKMRSCVAAAKTRSDVDGCEKYANESTAGADPDNRGRRSEAELNLKAIEKSLKVNYIEMAEFPRGSAPLTPATACCEGPNHKCAADPAAWMGNEVWDKLDFSVDEPGYFQYSYESDGTKATVKAVGDLDCDMTTVEYVLEATQVNGAPTFTLTKPARPD